MRRLTSAGTMWVLYILSLASIVYSCATCAHGQGREDMQFNAYVAREARRTGVTVQQVDRLWHMESGRFRDVTPDGKLGECGRAQILLSTARDYEPTVTRSELRTKWVNTRIMFKHLRSIKRQLLARGVADSLLPALMFTAYNRGAGAVLKSLKHGRSGWTRYGMHVANGTQLSGAASGHYRVALPQFLSAAPLPAEFSPMYDKTGGP